ncbi:carcinoembryonic antigen-related cell adhesion molecule 16 isoform X1 [Chelonia mydas]|uniref:carcinoembryonic antigen-related cell adhesion molecule 16 isoform X1 n=1 Tax=Chelonia mydas TaxID=8469 RepID=UPI001CA7F1F2|nr:carcinoembryonic antigen-related cell adhesion molecule 16 isoform X1 [Chelonia mydas]
MGRIPHRPGGPWTGILLAASVLGSCLQPAPAQTPVTIVLTPPSPAVGGGVSLAPQNPPQDLVSCSWYRSATTDETSRILTYYPGPPPGQTNGSAHTGRETAGPGCALHIAGLTLNDTGNYTVQILSPTGPRLATVHLPVSASVLGSCLQPAPAQTPVTIVLTPPSPAVGGGVSLAPQPAPQDFLLCSWYRSDNTDGSSRILNYIPGTSPVQTNGSAHTGRETAGPGCALHIAGLTLSDTGNYTVQIQSETSPAVTIRVHLPVSGMLPKPTVTPNQTQVLENGNFTLTCNSSPSADTVLWLRDGASLAPSDRLGLSPDNRTLTVLGVTRGDAGAYQCEVRNPVSTNRSEPSTVTVAYGPDSARIDPPGPIDLTLGSPLTLSCVADSVPAPSYRWVLNGTNTNETGTSLTFNPTTLDHQGTYECQAHNPITNRTARASVAVRVTGTDPVAPRPGLSAGAIAGIIIGSLAGAALVGVGAYFLYSRRRNETPKETGAPYLVYENLPPTAGAGPVAQPGSPPDPSPTYQTLQPRQQDVYEELKK